MLNLLEWHNSEGSINRTSQPYLCKQMTADYEELEGFLALVWDDELVNNFLCVWMFAFYISASVWHLIEQINGTACAFFVI